MPSPHPFVPPDFEVPEGVENAEFRLRMLTVNDLVKDYDAVMSSVDELLKVWPRSGWPKGLTIEQDLIDLGWHQKEFLIRSTFAYTVVTLDESEVLGCVYIEPTRKSGYDAEAYSWARETPLGTGMDARLFDCLRDWLREAWPFENVAFPGRTIEWDEWRGLPDEKR